jgi:hypothetical protein
MVGWDGAVDQRNDVKLLLSISEDTPSARPLIVEDDG